MEILPIGESFAREVADIDCAAPLSDSDAQALREAWSQQGVLVFRRQLLTESALVQFSEVFGEPERIVVESFEKSQIGLMQMTHQIDDGVGLRRGNSDASSLAIRVLAITACCSARSA